MAKRIILALHDELPESIADPLCSELTEDAELRFHFPRSPEDWSKTFSDIEVLIQWGEPYPISSVLLADAKNLRMIQVYGIGVDSIDLVTAREKGIIVSNMPGTNAESVAQHTLGLIVGLASGIVKWDMAMRAGRWITRTPENEGIELWGKTLGVIGCGRIGKRVGMKMRATFGMRVLAYDPYIPHNEAQLGSADTVSLDELLRLSDVITIHCPLTEETRGMVGQKELEMMKHSAILVNTARAGIIDEDALYHALKSKRIRGAALDVHTKEPLARTSVFMGLDNIILTPHIAAYTSEAAERTYSEAARNVGRYLRGEPIANMIDMSPEGLRRIM